MAGYDDRRKADLIKKALTIVDELGRIDVEYPWDEEDLVKLMELTERAQNLKKDRLWKLK